MTAPAPNPAPDRSPSEAYLRQRLVGAGDTVEVQSGAVEAVLAELDRQRAELAQLRAGVQAAGQDQAALRAHLEEDLRAFEGFLHSAAINEFTSMERFSYGHIHRLRAALARSAPAIPEPETSEQVPSLDWSLPIVLAELDRQRALIAAVLAEVDAREQWAQPWQTAGLSCAEIRDLLEGEKR